MINEGSTEKKVRARSLEELVAEQRSILLAVDAELRRLFEDDDAAALQRLKILFAEQKEARSVDLKKLHRERLMARTAAYFGADLTGALVQILQLAQQVAATGRPLVSTCFDEAYYLMEHQDVAAQVRAGGLSSGFEHWILYGIAERRKTRFLSDGFDFESQAAAVRGARERARKPDLFVRLMQSIGLK